MMAKSHLPAGLISNLGGVTGLLLSLDGGKTARQLRLDVLYPIAGFKRCLDAQNGFGGLQTLIPILSLHTPIITSNADLAMLYWTGFAQHTNSLYNSARLISHYPACAAWLTSSVQTSCILQTGWQTSACCTARLRLRSA